MQKHPMTKEGADALQTELTKLKKEDRPRITEEIATAREHGDLKENAEYHASREDQGLIEGRIKQIEAVLSLAQVIDVTRLAANANGKVIFGATVTILNIDTDEELTYKIVGHDEADIKHNKISVNSPLARALIGKQKEDEVIVTAPKGNIDYDVVQVQYI